MEFVTTLIDRGGPLMWPLLLCSLASLTITIERMLFWLRQRLACREARIERIIDAVEAGRYQEAEAEAAAGRDASSRVLWSGLCHRGHGLSEALHTAAAAQIEAMKQGLGVLDTVVTLAPLLGILGTVTGIIESFDLLGASGIEDPRAVTGGIAQALVTTAAGLTVAIVTLIPLNALVARVQRATRVLENVGTRLEVACRRGSP